MRVTGLGRVTTLDLEKARITSLQSGDFAGLSGLQTLNLKDNALSTLPANVFAGLTALDSLDLESNALTRLDAGMFAGLRLQVLRLSRSPFKSNDGLPTGIFDAILPTLDPGQRRDMVDAVGRRAHFVCSRRDADAIVAVTAGVKDCISVTAAQLNAALPRIDARLSALKLSTGGLKPAFNPAITDYTVNVDDSVDSVTVTPTATQSDATIVVAVNGEVASDTTMQAIVLPTATPVPITFVVTAPGGGATEVYTVSVASGEPLVPAATLTGPLTEAGLFASTSTDGHRHADQHAVRVVRAGCGPLQAGRGHRRRRDHSRRQPRQRRNGHADAGV